MRKTATGSRALLRERYISKELKSRQEARIDKLYSAYSSGVRKMAPGTSPMAKEEFTYQLFGRKAGMSGEKFAVRLAAKTANVPTRLEAILTKRQAEGLGIDVTGVTPTALRKDKGLMSRIQGGIYEELKKRGMTTEELQDWWTENIVGSD